MDEGKGARKSDPIMETPTRNEQPSECVQVLPKKPRSAIKKDLIAFFGDGRRTPAPSTEGSPIETVKQRQEYSPAGKGDSRTGAGGEDGRQQQLAYSYREEEEGQYQVYTSGCRK
jgi:hypothetical protein